MPTAPLPLQDEILALEAATTAFEPDAARRREWQAAANQAVNAFLGSLQQLPTYAPPGADFFADFDLNLGGAPQTDIGPAVRTISRAVASAGILTAGAGHLAFVPGGGLYIGAVADHLAATLNPFSADAFASPAAVAIHKEVVRWLAGMIGYGPEAWGDLTSGGSHATLTAFFVARESCGLRARDYEHSCVYLSEHTHHCVEKALHILCGRDLNIRYVPLKEHALDPAAVRALVAADRQAGLKPWLLVATAGSTNLGRVDPLAELAAVAKDCGLWLHADAACGGFFKLCPELATRFAGLEMADSVVLDPHKGMFLPYGLGAVMFKEGAQLHKALHHTGVYLQDREGDLQRSPMDYSLELTRPFRSLRLWLALKIHGEELWTQALREKLLLAQYGRSEIAKIPKLQLVGTLDLSIFAFRYFDPASPETSDDETRALLKRINQHPEAFLSSTMVDGQFVIRVAILSFRTHLKTIDALLATLRAEVEGR